MAEIATLHTVVPPDPGFTAIRDKWTRMARFRWLPADTEDWSAKMSVTTTSDEGTVGQIRCRVVSTGAVTSTMTVVGPEESRLFDPLGLGRGPKQIIVEARRVSGPGGVRVLAASGAAVLTALVGGDPEPPEGSARALLGPLVARATASTSGTGLYNVIPPDITGTAEVGQTLTVSTGVWSAEPASFEYVWEVV